MSDPRSDRGAYLERVALRLHLHPASEADVIDELKDHIAESVAGLRAEGLAPQLAEREALARLGDPGELADGIRRARHSRRRLLVAAGYGVWAAAGGAFWGYLFAFGVVVLSAMLSMGVVSALVNQLQVSVSGWENWPSTLSIPYAAFVSGYAGRRAPVAFARRSDRPVAPVARLIALAGGAVLAIVSIFLIRVPLDPVTVIVLSLVPIGFTVGAWTSSDTGRSGGRLRISGRRIIALVLLSTLGMTAFGVASLRINANGLEGQPDPALKRIGRPASDVLGSAWVGTSSSWTAGAPLELTLTAEPPDALKGWRDLRLEAWPAADEEAFVDPSASGPAVTMPLIEQEGGWSGQIDAPVAKERSWFVIVSTGTAPDGQRYVLSGPDSHLSTRPWVGSVWEWLTTP